jgi:hypothetical protein
MVTRSQASGLKPGKFVTCHVVLQVLPKGDLYDLGEIDEYEEAIPAALQRGGIPESWDITVADVNPARVIVACSPERIDTMEDFNLNRTWSKAKPKFNVSPPLKPKAKAVPLLPEKLVGPPPDAAFAAKSPPPKVPGIEGQELGFQQFKIVPSRPVLQGSPSFLVLVQVEGEMER